MEARDRGGRRQVGGDAAHPVVGCRCDGYRGLQGLKPEGPATTQDRGELALEPLPPHRPQVEPEVIDPLPLHAAGQGPAHLIARCQIAAGQIRHWTGPGGITESRSFPPHRLADQEVGGSGQHQGGGMELHEFQVAHLRAGAPGHRHPVAAGLGGVGGVGEQMAAATAGQQHHSSPQPAEPITVQHLQADAATCLHPQLHGQQTLALHQTLSVQNLPLQGVHQRSAGAVLGVQHPPMAVGGLEGGAQLVAVAVEGHAELHEPLHAAGGLAHQHLNRLRLTEPGACPQCVFHMACEAVLRARHRGDAALGPAACRTRCGALAQQ